MSTEVTVQPETRASSLELTITGKRIEMLRIERGISKQQLAGAAGISRQQLWRVLAGKSELTSSLCSRIASALGTDSVFLRDPASKRGSRSGMSGWIALDGVQPATSSQVAGDVQANVFSAAPPTLADFLAGTRCLRAALAAFPSCTDGAVLKRAVLGCIEDIAIARGISLAPEFFELRRAVIAREL